MNFLSVLESLQNDRFWILSLFFSFLIPYLFVRRKLRVKEKLWKTWEGGFSCIPHQIVNPTSVEEIQSIVVNARKNGFGVKPYGSAHSWSDIALPSSDSLDISGIPTKWISMSLDNLCRILHVDLQKKLVTVQAGIRLKDLYEQLELYGLSMPNSGSIAEQSIAGAFATGTHGTGRALKILASTVISLKIVDGNGEFLTVSEKENEHLFKACLVHLGCLGIVTEYTLQVVDAFNLEEERLAIDIKEFFINTNQYFERNDFVKLWIVPHSNPPRARLWLQNRTTKKRSKNFLRIWLDRHFIVKYFYSPTVRLVSRSASFTRLFMRILSPLICQRTSGYVDRSDRVLRCGYLPIHSEAEYSVPIERAAYYCGALMEMIERQRHKMNMCPEVRFVAKDNIWMSGAEGRDSCFITVTGICYTHQEKERLWKDVEELFSATECRPHWGKYHSLGYHELRQRFAHLDEFCAIREKMDPDRIFVNGHIARLLGVSCRVGK